MQLTKRFVISREFDFVLGNDQSQGDRIYVIIRVIEGKKAASFGITIPELEGLAKALHEAKGEPTYRAIVAKDDNIRLIVQHSERRSSILLERYEEDNVLRIFEAADPREEFHTKLDAVLSAIDEMQQEIAKDLGVALLKVRENDGRSAGTPETQGEPDPNANESGIELDSQTEAQAEAPAPSEALLGGPSASGSEAPPVEQLVEQ